MSVSEFVERDRVILQLEKWADLGVGNLAGILSRCYQSKYYRKPPVNGFAVPSEPTTAELKQWLARSRVEARAAEDKRAEDNAMRYDLFVQNHMGGPQ